MRKFKHGITLAALVAISALGLYGCGGDSTATPVAPTATTAAAAAPTDTAVAMAVATDTTVAMEAPTATTGTTSGSNGGATGSSDALSLLKTSGTAMKGVKSYHMVLKVDSSGSTISGEGDVIVPDKAHLTMNMGASGTAEVIVIGTTSYTKIPGSDAFIETDGGPSMLGSSTDTSLFADYAQNATIVGDETLHGVDTTHVKLTYDADKAADAALQQAGQAVTTPSTGLGSADADLWIEKSSTYIHQLQTVSATAGITSTSLITFSKYNEDVTPPIEKPTNIQAMPTMPAIPTP